MTTKVQEIAAEFVDLWETLTTEQTNLMLAKNVPYDLLKFFNNYSEHFLSLSIRADIPAETLSEVEKSLAQLLIIGYIIRVLEERVD
jgi:hypothetical protein